MIVNSLGKTFPTNPTINLITKGFNNTKIQYHFSYKKDLYRIIVYRAISLIEDRDGGLVYQMYGDAYPICYGSYGFNRKLGGALFEGNKIF